MLVPQQIPDAASWRLADFGSATRVSRPAAADDCRVLFDQVPDAEMWLVNRITLSCTSSSWSRALVYDGDDDPRQLLDGTPVGNLDVADMSSPIQLEAGGQLLIVWDGVSDGAIGTARAQWSIMRRT